MAPIKSNRTLASYFDFFSKSGTDAVNPAPPPPPPVEASGGTKITHNNVVYHIFTGTAPFNAPADFNRDINYIIIGGGGGAATSTPSGSAGGGGGGAGAVIDKSSVSLSGPFNLTATVGAAGAKSSANNVRGSAGVASSINFATGTLTAAGGGAGGISEGAYGANPPSGPSNRPGNPGGSGGGSGLYYPGLGGPASGSPFPGTPGNSPDTGWGHGGGRGGTSGSPQNPFYYNGGGGGAGGVGEPGGNGSYSSGGTGGNGYLLPTIFQLPAPAMAPEPYGDPGPSGGAYWVAGGGAAGMYYHPSDSPETATQAVARGGGASHGPGAAGFAGAGNGVVSSTSGTHYQDHTDALQNSGSGGGGGGGSATLPGGPGDGGSGGSGIILISYPIS